MHIQLHTHTYTYIASGIPRILGGSFSSSAKDSDPAFAPAARKRVQTPRAPSQEFPKVSGHVVLPARQSLSELCLSHMTTLPWWLEDYASSKVVILRDCAMGRMARMGFHFII